MPESKTPQELTDENDKLRKSYAQFLDLVRNLEPTQDLTELLLEITERDPNLAAAILDTAQRFVACFGSKVPEVRPIIDRLIYCFNEETIKYDFGSYKIYAKSGDEKIFLVEGSELFTVVVELAIAAHEKMSQGKRKIQVDREKVEGLVTIAQAMATTEHKRNLLAGVYAR